MVGYTTSEVEEKKTWVRPVYRNLRLFIKLFIATFKYGVVLSAVVFISLYAYYIFFVDGMLSQQISDWISDAFPSAAVDGSKAAGGRAQGCVIEGIPECDGVTFTDREVFRPIN